MSTDRIYILRNAVASKFSLTLHDIVAINSHCTYYQSKRGNAAFYGIQNVTERAQVLACGGVSGEGACNFLELLKLRFSAECIRVGVETFHTLGTYTDDVDDVLYRVLVDDWWRIESILASATGIGVDSATPMSRVIEMLSPTTISDEQFEKINILYEETAIIYHYVLDKYGATA